MTTANISISLPLEVLASIDQRRGQTPRSRFVSDILQRSLQEKEGAEETAAPPTARQIPRSKENTDV